MICGNTAALSAHQSRIERKPHTEHGEQQCPYCLTIDTNLAGKPCAYCHEDYCYNCHDADLTRVCDGCGNSVFHDSDGHQCWRNCACQCGCLQVFCPDTDCQVTREEHLNDLLEAEPRMRDWVEQEMRKQ
jgi:hypothetical protein